jgi:tRNA (uracil-5-)-methyltransferase
MTCSSFGKCGSCTLWEYGYKEQLELKVEKIKKEFDLDSLDVITSKEENFRFRAEFRLYHDDSGISYAMSGFDKRLVKIDECSIVSKTIQLLMKKLLTEIQKSEILKKKLFAVEFLTTTTNDAIITLIYHKKIDEAWLSEAKKIDLDANIIGRSRGVKK